jgi:flagellar basal body rod protein FlgC
MPKIGQLYVLQGAVATAQSALHHQQVRVAKAKENLAAAQAGLAAADEQYEAAKRALEDYQCVTT